MSERAFYDIAFYLCIGSAVLTAIGLVFITAPYGRHTRAGWGPQIPSTVGWIVMEAPASLVFLAIYLSGLMRFSAVPLLFLSLWQLHYVQRAFVFPFLRRGGNRPMPWSVVAMAVFFNVLNAYLNARWISHFGSYPLAWLTLPRTLFGIALFVAGWAINLDADARLRRLRAPGETGYKIPAGGLYELISCPNYFGELLEWTGWAIATWSPGGLAFAIFTAANLLPRAVANHRWYKAQFLDYPRQRRIIFPFIY